MSVGTKEKGKTEQKIAISSPTPILTMDTTQNTDKNTFTMVQHLFEGLVRFDKDTQVVPGIAESYDVSPDGLTYTFKIRPEAKWSDRRSITSKDFAYAWKRLVNPKTQGPNAYLLDSVKKSSEIRTGKAKIEEIGLETPDDQTFIVQLNGLVPRNLYQNPETKEDFRAYSGNYLTYNIKEAKNSWKQAQKKVGQEVVLNLLASDDEQGKKVSEYLKSQIEENLTGISIDITLQPKNNVNQLRQDKDYEISLSGWIAGSSELDSYFNLYVGDSAYNYGNFNNSTYNQFVETAKTKHANQPNQQFEDYQQAEIQLLDQEVAQVPIYQSASNYLVSKKLKNIEYPLYGGYFFLRNAEKIN